MESIKKILSSAPVAYGMLVSIISSYGAMALMFLGTRGWSPEWLTMDMLQDVNGWIVATWSALGVLVGKFMIGYGFIKAISEKE